VEEQLKKIFKLIYVGAEVSIISYSTKTKEKSYLIRNAPCNDIIFVKDENLIGLNFCFTERQFSFRIENIQIKDYNIVISTPIESNYYDEILITPVTTEQNYGIINRWKMLKKRKNLTKQDIFTEPFYQDGI